MTNYEITENKMRRALELCKKAFRDNEIDLYTFFARVYANEKYKMEHMTIEGACR